jgi:hypothetical protein
VRKQFQPAESSRQGLRKVILVEAAFIGHSKYELSSYPARQFAAEFQEQGQNIRKRTVTAETPGAIRVTELV